MQNANVLWIDDQPNQISSIQSFLDHDHMPLKIDIAETLHEAEERLSSNVYHSVVVDLNMNPHDQYSDSGAEWLERFSEQYKYLPSFVYSAYLSDPVYNKWLERSYIIKSMSKNDSFEAPYSKHWFLHALEEYSLRTLKVSNLYPENIKFEEYINNPQQFTEQFKSHWTRFGHWISKYIERNNLAWVVMCGDSIVKESEKLQEFPSEEELIELGHRYGRIPFAYSESYLPEQIGWYKLPKDDYYPCMQIILDGNIIMDDFDTGAVQTHVSDNIIKQGILDAVRDGSGFHLGDEYRFFTKKINILVEIEQGSPQNGQISLAVVKDWENSSFVKINRQRRALIGRDVLNSLGLVVVLDGRNKQSKII